MASLPRKLTIQFSLSPRGSGAVFLWGPRQTGKTTALKILFPDAELFDLLDTTLLAQVRVRPGLFRTWILERRPEVVIIDEVQKAPELMDEVHWLLENTSTRFVLCGSSARKLRRSASNLLGGRAVEYALFPLVSAEISDLDLTRYVNFGGLPPHYLGEKPDLLLRSYVNTYLKEEIIDEAATRNIPAFSRFLSVIAASHGQQLQIANAARESGVSVGTLRNYFQILRDTLLGFDLEPWRTSAKRRMVETAKFYLFDIGLANALRLEPSWISEGTDLFGRGFEHFIITEVRAFLSYAGSVRHISYWRTSSQLEVDLIIGQMDVAIECKATTEVSTSDLKGMRALLEEHRPRRSLIVCREQSPRRTIDGIEIIPWRAFCQELWSGQLLGPSTP